MGINKEYADCERIILKEYQELKNKHSHHIICSHIGEFSQDILISLVSLTKNSLLKDTHLTGFKRRLEYIIVEIVQNIIRHSDKIENESLLAYFMVIEGKDAFHLYSSNTIFNKKTPKLVDCINSLLKADMNELNTILEKNLQSAELNQNGRAGIGLLSTLYKTDKNFSFELKQTGEEISILSLSLSLKKLIT